MTYKHMHLRTGLTAIAAVLALSATPLSAQETAPVPDPVVDPPAETTAAPDPLAPEPTTAEPAAADSLAPAPDAATSPARTVTRRAAAKPKAAAAHATKAATISAAPAVAPEPQPTAVAQPIAEPPPPPPAEAPAAEPVIALDNLPTLDREAIEQAAPIAGAAGLGLLALAGVGLAVRRRRRREEREHFEANQAYLDQHLVAETPSENEPAFVRDSEPAVAATAPEATVLTDAPKTKLPEGFDLSRFGPHVRAAYLGPTPDNPSWSLKHRLRKAAVMDQRAQQAAEATADQRPLAQAAQPARPQWSAENAGFMLRPDSSRAKPQPAYQK